MANIIKPNLSSDFAIMAESDTAKILEAQGVADKVTRDVILSRAFELHADEQKSADWLAGYEAALTKAGKSEGSAKVRKSEARQVFKAFHVEHLNSSSDTHKERDAHAMLVLGQLEGDYHQFISKCRDMANKGDTAGTGTSRAGTIKKIQAEDRTKILNRLNVSGVSESMAMLQGALLATIKQGATPIAIVRQCETFAAELGKMSEPFYANLGKKIADLCNKAEQHAAKAEAVAKAKATPAKKQQSDNVTDIVKKPEAEGKQTETTETTTQQVVNG
jgi:hypothetical protein